MEWVSAVYVLFELCVLSPDATRFVDDQKERPIWVDPYAVSAFTVVWPARPESVSNCTAMQVGTWRFHVVGSPQEICSKLTQYRGGGDLAVSCPR